MANVFSRYESNRAHLGRSKKTSCWPPTTLTNSPRAGKSFSGRVGQNTPTLKKNNNKRTMASAGFTDSGRILKMEVDYSETVDEKIPVCQKLCEARKRPVLKCKSLRIHPVPSERLIENRPVLKRLKIGL
ncbi:hypothetical protein TNCV_2980561 [Trichonephila clavipes]|nr:hypothetical protein TNCV_2980561 [Trichonephila clavipes]